MSRFVWTARTPHEAQAARGRVEFGPDQMRARADRCEAVGNHEAAAILRRYADEVDAINRDRKAKRAESR